MLGFAARRLAQSIPVLVGISVVTWALMAASPDDPARIYANQQAVGGRAEPAEIEQARELLGLTGSPVEQYVRWARRALSGDLGESFRTGQPVTTEIVDRLPATLELAGGAVLVTLLLGLPLGVIAAVWANRWPDHVARLVALIGGAVPAFWLSLLLIWLFAVEWRWLPSNGRGGLDHLVLPALALGAAAAGGYVRLLRASLLETLGEDYVVAARARGLRGSAVLVRHALRNALIPVVSQLGVTVGVLLSGSVVVEVIFSWPGIGRYAVDSIARRDLPALQGFVLFSALVYLGASLAVDLAYRWLDPRVGRRGAER